MKKHLFLFLSVLLLVCSCKQNSSPKKPSFTVSSENDGFHVSINCDSKYKHTLIKVLDIEEGKYNFDCEFDGTKDSVYPFVEKDKKYEILVYLYEDDGEDNWIKEYYVGSVDITAAGGLGDAKLFTTGVNYDGLKTLSLKNYSLTKPADVSGYGSADIYTTNKDYLWDDDYKKHAVADNYDKKNLDLSSSNELKFTMDESVNSDLFNDLENQSNFWLRFTYYLFYNNKMYISRYTSNFIFTYRTSAEKYCINNLTLINTNNGFKFIKGFNTSYPHTRISVYNETNNKAGPSISSDGSYREFDYSYLKSGESYTVYYEIWDSNWGSYNKYELTHIVAKGGNGECTFEYQGVTYSQDNPNGIESSIDFIDPSFTNLPAKYSVTGNLWFSDNTHVWYDDYRWTTDNKGSFTIYLNKHLKDIKGKTFWPEMVAEWDLNGTKYQLTLINDSSFQCKDNHTTVNTTIESDYRIITTPGTYTVHEKYKSKNAYLVKYNRSNNIVNDKWPVASNISTTEDRFEKARSAVDALEKWGIDKSEIHRYEIDFEGVEAGKILGPRIISRNASASNPYSSYVVNSTTHTFKEGTGVLKAIGEHCNVWYLNNNDLAHDLLMKKMDDTKYTSKPLTFESIADTFDKLYDYETYFIGSNIPNTRYYNIIKTIDENTKIDIFIFDIGDKYNEKMTRGLFGYFDPKDLIENQYLKDQSSNEREMFYIDSAFLAMYTEEMYSTLAHEFQHLLLYVNKYLNCYNSIPTWYTEMLSLGMEDLLQYECLGYEDNEALKDRIPYFNAGYFAGFEYWGEEDFVYFSYANAALFIDFLMKNYGGADLYYEIARNNYVGEESVTKALKAMGYNETFDSVMMRFGLMIINAYNDNLTEESYTVYKQISNTETIHNENVALILKPLDLSSYTCLNLNEYDKSFYTFDQRYIRKTEYGKEYGPTILKPNVSFNKIYNKAITVSYLGTELDKIEISETVENTTDMAIFFSDVKNTQ